MRYQAAVLAGLLIAGQARAAPDPTVAYSLKPVLTNGQLTSVAFEMRFYASQAQTEIDLPDSWGGGTDFYRALKDLEITGASEISIPPDQPAHRLITAAPGAPIVIRYHLDANRDAGEEAPADTDMTYPVIGPDRFHILGQQVWPTLAGDDDLPATFHADLPDGWTLASNLENLAAIHGTDTNVKRSVMLAGRDVHITSATTPNTQLRIATAGTFAFPLSDFDDRVTRIITTEQAFWGDGQPAYLVTLVPITATPGAQSNRGTGLGDAFAMMTAPDMPIARISVSLAHEYFHSWNIDRLGQPEPDPDTATGYWFSEGFTDYYGRKLALKAGVISLEDFAAEWNEAMSRYATSPHKTAANADVRDTYWQDPAWQKMPYDRGALLAAYLNAEWRPKGMTLDRFMHALRDKVAVDPAFGTEPIHERVEQMAADLGVPVSGELTRFIDKGDAIVLPPDAFGGCLQVTTEDAPDVDFGYDRSASVQTGVFAGVDPAGKAYAAGLRDGMTRIDRKGGDPFDSSVPVTFVVRDAAGRTLSITYLPQGKTSHIRQRVVVPAGLSDAARAACVTAVTG